MGLPAARAGSHLPPFCGGLLVKFHRYLHDMSTLCLLKIQDGGSIVKPGTVERGDTHSSFLAAPQALLTPVPAPENGPWTPVPL